MAIQTLSFYEKINSSAQVGDHLYYATVSVYGVTTSPLQAGKITAINHSSRVISYEANEFTQPTSGKYILFSKPIQIEESSLKGYYADVTFTNRSTKRAELFAVSSEIALSSK